MPSGVFSDSYITDSLESYLPYIREYYTGGTWTCCKNCGGGCFCSLIVFHGLFVGARGLVRKTRKDG